MTVQAYSQLKRVLGERRMSVPELQRRIKQRGLNANLKSLYRLANDREPLERLDLRVAGAICRACDVPLNELIAFQENAESYRRLPAVRQHRLDRLMDRNTEGTLTPGEREELLGLVREAEAITLHNARLLASQQQRLNRRA